jgi:hypothetical protein
MVAVTVPIEGTAHDFAYWPGAPVLDSADLFESCYTDGPHATPLADVEAIRATGKGILWNHERGALDLLGGSTAGTLAAQEAMAAVIAAGTPTDGSCAIAYSVDGNVGPADFQKALPAFQAIKLAHGGRFLTGYYGDLALYKYLKAAGLVQTKCWLSASASFPGYDPNDPDVGLIQTVGTDIPGTDRDLVTDLANLGVWMTQVDLTPASITLVADAVWHQILVPASEPYAGNVYGDLMVRANQQLDPLLPAIQAIVTTMTDQQAATLVAQILAGLAALPPAATKQDVIDAITATIKIGATS